MNSKPRSAWIHVFRRLLELFPRAWRRRYAEEAEELFRELHAEKVRERGRAYAAWCAFLGCAELVPQSLRVHASRWAETSTRRRGLDDLAQAGRWLSRAPVALPMWGAVLAIAASLAPLAFMNGLDRAASHPVGLAEPDELAVVRRSYAGFACCLLSLEEADRIVAAVPEVSFTGYQSLRLELTTPDASSQVRAYRVLPGFFDVLGVQPEAGRFFRSADAGEPVAVLSEASSSRAGRPGRRLGETIRVGGVHRRVIGTVPSRIVLPGEPMVFLPWDTAGSPGYDEVTHGTLAADAMTLLARTRAGFGLDELDRALSALERPESAAASRGLAAGPIDAWYVPPSMQRIRPASERLAWAVFLATLVSVAALAFVAVGRLTPELRARGLLGASPARLVVQLSLLGIGVTLLGAGAAATVVWVAESQLQAALLPEIPRGGLAIGPGDALLGVAGAAGLACIGVGLSMLMAAVRLDLPLGPGERGVLPATGVRLAMLVQVAVTTVLLAQAAALAADWAWGGRVRTGPSRPDVLTVRVAAPSAAAGGGQARWRAYRGARQGLERLGGLRTVGAAAPPFSLYASARPGPPGREARDVRVELRRVDEGFFGALDLQAPARPPPGGNADDITWMPGDDVAVLDESAARTLFGDQDPLGRTVWSPGVEASWTVVGVARDGAASASDPVVYLPLDPGVEPELMFVLRVGGEPEARVAAARTTIASAAPGYGIVESRDLDSVTPFRREPIAALGRARVSAGLTMAAIAAFVSALLAEIVVRERAREFRIRRALGASTGDLAGELIRRVSTPWIAGLLAGAATASVVGAELPTFVHSAPTSPIRAALGVVPLMIGIFLLSTVVTYVRSNLDSPAALFRE